MPSERLQRRNACGFPAQPAHQPALSPSPDYDTVQMPSHHDGAEATSQKVLGRTASALAGVSPTTSKQRRAFIAVTRWVGVCWPASFSSASPGRLPPRGRPRAPLAAPSHPWAASNAHMRARTASGGARAQEESTKAGSGGRGELAAGLRIFLRIHGKCDERSRRSRREEETAGV